MSAVATLLPARRSELVVRPLGDDGQHVVKDPDTGAYFELGPVEHFLLTRLVGSSDPTALCAAFEEQFGQPLSDDDLSEFVEMARARKLLRESPAVGSTSTDADDVDSEEPRQSLLYWRKSLFDPDRLCTWLEPRLRPFWTRGFVMLSATSIVLAILVVWANRAAVVNSFTASLRWETAIWAWLTLFLVTLLHEFAHGLTCKHYGGEVHEIGFLMVFFMPCFYCNVSDAWLFREKSKRMWVTFAGGYFELFLWSLAVFVWRITPLESFPNYLAFIVVTACGVQTLFNFNPLLKLDGYYLLSDWKGIPNLKQRAAAHTSGHVRRLLWGAPRPEPERRGRFLLAYGLASWLFSVGFLIGGLFALGHLAGAGMGWLGVAGVVLLAVLSIRGLFRGFTGGEVGKMILTRRKRTIMWFLILSGAGMVLVAVPIDDRAGGDFQIRSTVRADIRAPVSGFIREVLADEGERVSPGMLLIRLETPDLAARSAQNRAEIRKAAARLRSMEQEVVEQRKRVERNRAWRDAARTDLTRAEQSLAEDLNRIDKQIVQAQAMLDAAQASLLRAKVLSEKRNLSDEDRQEAERRYRVSQALLAQFEAERRALEIKGAADSKIELDRREKELLEARATLDLLESPTRKVELDAERARLDGFQEEARHLESLQTQLSIHSPVGGLVTTPRLNEKIGQFVREGELICAVEEPQSLEAEIAMPEQEIARVQVGQTVGLKARALPFETFSGRVDRIAPAAGKGEGQSSVTICCRMSNVSDLRPGMTGHAKIYTGERSIGSFAINRAMRYLRTEFWW